MAVTTKKETIFEYIRTNVIPLINGEDNYNLSASRISRKFLIPDELDGGDFPCVCIIDDDTTAFSPLTAEEYTTGNTAEDIQSGIPVWLIGYVSISELGDEGDAGELSTEMNKLYSDMIIAMLSDITQGGNALATSLLSSANSLYHSEEKMVGTVVQKYILKYDFSPFGDTPTT